MKLNYIASKELYPILEKYGFQIVQERTDYIKIASKITVIIISENSIENSYTLWVGRNNELSNKIEIDNELISKLFTNKFVFNFASTIEFMNSVVAFFKNTGKPILEGNDSLFSELEQLDRERNIEYNSKISEQQNFKAIDKAWQNNDYFNFIKIIDEQMNNKILPKSYSLKYKIAKQKLETPHL